MEYLALLAVAALILISPDPSPSLVKSSERSHRYSCERVSTQVVQQTRPGAVRPDKPRGDYVERDAVICTERLVRPGLRKSRDEAVLGNLDERAARLAATAHGSRPDLHDRTWLVEVFYPNIQVSSKLSFATKNALMHQGLGVSDRLMGLAAGDVDVLTRMSPYEAYPAACTRYEQTGSLGEGDVLLAVVSLDPRETQLHAGLCDGGQWSWLP